MTQTKQTKQMKSIAQPTLSRSGFEAIFKVCMSQEFYISYQWDAETGREFEDKTKIDPCMVIRDFIIGDDISFRDVEAAWRYFQSVQDYCRVMDSAGLIYFDGFREVEQ